MTRRKVERSHSGQPKMRKWIKIGLRFARAALRSRDGPSSSEEGATDTQSGDAPARHPAAYALSLPERLLRSLAAGLGGAARAVAEFALPGMVRRSTVYSVVVDRALRFIIEDVGQVEGVYQSRPAESAYAARKVVGNFLEAAGFLALHASPLWVLALVGDAALGVRSYLDILVDELKAKQVLDRTDTVESVSALLSRLERLSAAGALAIDLPPTTLAELKRMAAQARQEAGGAAQDLAAFQGQADRLLEPMRELAAEEGVSLLDVSAVVGMKAAETAGSALRASIPLTSAVVAAGARTVNQEIISYYAATIADLRRRGFYTTLRETYAPYAATVAGHFRPERRTATERLLSGRAFRRRAEKRPRRGS